MNIKHIISSLTTICFTLIVGLGIFLTSALPAFAGPMAILDFCLKDNRCSIIDVGSRGEYRQERFFVEIAYSNQNKSLGRELYKLCTSSEETGMGEYDSRVLLNAVDGKRLYVAFKAECVGNGER
ncbi:hypothetical protein [Moorena sp. SIO4G3]|uniref:hypothetical protein n=1 Tax=Moorena sp. SIO4G3 TaxID=2607821 RepID=UPI00142D10B6|nr:hypothetical protein [Moorena sp. SIO4G3]NEO79810.1 hypothetical protein [Moorena sp. SIO4G3]